MVKSRWMRCNGDVAIMGDKRNAYKLLVEMTEGN
jgi:hypothetical protein